MTKAEIDLIVGWLAEPESFDFLQEDNRKLLANCLENLKKLRADNKPKLFWARFLEYVAGSRTRPPSATYEIVEVFQENEGLGVRRMGSDGIWKFDEFIDYSPIAAPPLVNSPS